MISSQFADQKQPAHQQISLLDDHIKLHIKLDAVSKCKNIGQVFVNKLLRLAKVHKNIKDLQLFDAKGGHMNRYLYRHLIKQSKYAKNILSHPIKPGMYNLNGVHGEFKRNMLISALSDGHFDLAEMLSLGGINIYYSTQLDQDRTTALHVAVAAGNEEILNMLIQLGAYVNVKGQFSSTPLHYVV